MARSVLSERMSLYPRMPGACRGQKRALDVLGPGDPNSLQEWKVLLAAEPSSPVPALDWEVLKLFFKDFIHSHRTAGLDPRRCVF